MIAVEQIENALRMPTERPFSTQSFDHSGKHSQSRRVDDFPDR
jgi:hypothetical protein